MTLTLLFAAAAGASAAVVFATVPLLGTRSRARFLAPHVGRGETEDALAALGMAVSQRIDRALGAVDPIAVRLARVHDNDDVTTFRFHQGALLLSTTVLATAIVLVLTPPPILALAVIAVLSLGAVGLPEVLLATRGARWSTSVRNELPIVGEHLVALLRSGRSPVVALEHIGQHDGSPLRQDVARVVRSIHRGSGLESALAEWSTLTAVESVRRLVGVLRLHHRTPDLAELVQGEVDAARDRLHRDLLAQIDRRGQQVWIPVTVAALVPGAIFLLIPFFDALRLFGATP